MTTTPSSDRTPSKSSIPSTLLYFVGLVTLTISGRNVNDGGPALVSWGLIGLCIGLYVVAARIAPEKVVKEDFVGVAAERGRKRRAASQEISIVAEGDAELVERVGHASVFVVGEVHDVRDSCQRIMSRAAHEEG
jgi:hypothetical protein